jgi:hypothetical protein
MRSPVNDRDNVDQEPPNPPVDSFEGKQVGLVDNGKKASAPVLDIVEERLREAYEDVEISRYAVEELNMLKDDDELRRIREWAARDTDVCIGAIGDCGSCTKFLARAVDAVEASGTPAVGLVVEGFELDYEMNAEDLGRELRYTVIPVRSETTDRDRIWEEITADVLRTIVGEVTSSAPSDASAGTDASTATE